MRLFYILAICLVSAVCVAQSPEQKATAHSTAFAEEARQAGQTIERTYYKGGQIKTEQAFVNGVAVTSPVTYYENGQVQQEAIPVGEFSGPIHTYYETGALRTMTTYKKGKKDGYMRVYHDNGQLKQEFYYTEGRMTHAGRQYFASGKLAADAEPMTGLMNRYDEETGRIIEKVPFIDGRKEGVRLFYDTQGHQTGFQACQNNVCGAYTDLRQKPWYQYSFPNIHASFWLVRLPKTMLQTSRTFVQERNKLGLLQMQQMTADDPQISILYAYNADDLLSKVTIQFPLEGVKAVVEKDYTYAPRTITWKLNGVPVWVRKWDNTGAQTDESLNKARITETKDEPNKTRRILIQSPDVTCPVYISFTLNTKKVFKTEDVGVSYWNKQQSITLRRSVLWAFQPDGRVSFMYFQVPEQYLRLQYAYGIASRMIGESWLETNSQGQYTQFDMSYLFNQAGAITGQTLSAYNKDDPFHQNSLWDTIRQNYDDMPVAAESAIKQ